MDEILKYPTIHIPAVAFWAALMTRLGWHVAGKLTAPRKPRAPRTKP